MIAMEVLLIPITMKIIKPEQFILVETIKITHHETKNPVIPKHAVLSDREKKEKYIFVNRNGIADRRIVELGISDDNLQEILTGVTEGEFVIIGPAEIIHQITIGKKVKTKPNQTKPNQTKPPILLTNIFKYFFQNTN